MSWLLEIVTCDWSSTASETSSRLVLLLYKLRDHLGTCYTVVPDYTVWYCTRVVLGCTVAARYCTAVTQYYTIVA
jgi:hypothetical protein